MAEEILGLLLLNGLFWVAGAGLLLLTGWLGPGELPRWPGLAYVAGVAWAGVAGELMLVCGLSFDRTELVAVALTPGAILLLLSHRRQLAPGPRLLHAGAHLIAVPAILIAGLGLARSTRLPMSAWDAWSFWTPKAESIVDFHGLSSAFIGSGVSNPDYPLLVPALESSAFRFMGTFDTTLVHVQFSLLFIAFIGAAVELFGVLLGPGERRREQAVILALIAAAPAMYVQSTDAYADAPLAIMVSLGALVLWRGVVLDARESLPLAALLFAAAMATKVEGMVFVAAVGAALALVCRGRPGTGRRILAVVGAAAAVSVVPWRLWLILNHLHGAYGLRVGYLVSRPERFAHALAALAGSLVSPANWLLLPLVVIAALSIGFSGGRRPEALFVLATVLISIAALDLTYWLSADPIGWYLATTTNRVVTAPLLVAVTFTPLLLAARTTRRSARRSIPVLSERPTAPPSTSPR